MANEIDSIEGEVWKPVLGWEGLYEVSSHGRVRNLPRKTRTKSGSMTTRAGGRIMKIHNLRTGYADIMLYDNDGRPRNLLVHRLVCEAFIGPRPDGMQVNHKNGKRADNRLDNLEYLTAKANNALKAVHGTRQHGERNNNSKLTDDCVAGIRRMRRAGSTIARIAKEFSVSTCTISRILNGHAWSHIE